MGKPEERCELTAEGSKVTAYEGCPLTCGKCHSSRRLELEFSMFEPDDMYPEPEPSCEDTDWNRNSGKGRDCAWVAIKPEERCELTAEGSKVTAYEGCPLTCGKCHSSRRLELEFSMFEPDDMYPEPVPSCEDTDWNRNSEKGRDCAWVAIKPEERCELTAEGSKVT